MKAISLAMVLIVVSCAAHAQDTLTINHAKLVRVRDSVQLTMQVDLRKSRVGKHEIVLVEPIIEAPEKAAVILPSVGIYGQYPYFYYIRSGNRWLQRKGDTMYRAAKVKRPISYVATLPYEAWMDTARVNITVSSNRYCDGTTTLSDFTVFSAEPSLHKGAPWTEVENKAASGQAHIDYVVGTTRINPTYHDNARELRRIGESIDSVRSDTANTISHITIKGYSSPEGPYQNNARLAKGRTESLTRHVASTYDIPRTMMRAEFEPEDWEGLRKRVDESALPHRKEILEVIDDRTLDSDPDDKLRIIRQRYPQDYRQMLRSIMPYLRRSDYTIRYNRRVAHVREGLTDTLWTLPRDTELHAQGEPAAPKPARPLAALKTNLLFDALLAPNVEVEVPFGRNRQWSIMAETWCPWWLFGKNKQADTNPLRLEGTPYRSNREKGYRNAYEVWMVGGELRRWLSRCRGDQPLMTGHFVGAYVAGGKYDIELKGVGDQGEFLSAGATWGYSWLLGKRWNLECSLSGGILWGPQRHYRGTNDDTHLIWLEDRNFFYAGPTKLKFSIAWLLGDTLRKRTRKEVRNE